MTNDPQASYITEMAGRNYLVDHEANRISFLDSRFYRCPDGTFVPSVTTILEAYPKGAGYWAWVKKHGEDSDDIRDEAGHNGTVVHRLTEDYDAGLKLNMMNDDGSARYSVLQWAMFERYIDFRKRFPMRILAVETKLAVKRLGYAGTLDRIHIMEVDGVLRLMDIKSGASVWPSAWLQQAAYHNLIVKSGLLERLVPGAKPEDLKLSILHVNAKTKGPLKNKPNVPQGEGWKLEEADESTEHYLDLFNKTHALWLAENAGQQPKQTTYQLTHQLSEQ